MSKTLILQCHLSDFGQIIKVLVGMGDRQVLGRLIDTECNNCIE